MSLNLSHIYFLNLDNWGKANKLHLNNDKTCYSVFSPNKVSVPTVTIKVTFTFSKVTIKVSHMKINVSRCVNTLV